MMEPVSNALQDTFLQRVKMPVSKKLLQETSNLPIVPRPKMQTTIFVTNVMLDMDLLQTKDANREILLSAKPTTEVPLMHPLDALSVMMGIGIS